MKLSLRNSATATALCLIFALAAVVRIECARDELWIDEYITAWTVAGSIDDVGERARISHQGPLYTWLMFGVTRLFGFSAASLRGLSVISGLALVIMVSWLAWQLTRLRSAAILAAFLAAVDPNFVFYASEARPYALVQLLGFCSACCAWNWYSRMSRLRDGKILDVKRIEIQPKIPLAIWIIATVEMFYSHFTSLFGMASQALCGWIAALRLGNGTVQWLVATIIALGLSIPGVLTLFAIYDRAGDWRAFSSLPDLLGSLQFFGLMYLLPAIAALACAGANRRIRKNADWIGIILLSSIALATIAVVIIVTGLRITPLGHYRYLIAATGVGPAIGASCLAIWKNGRTRGIVAAALAMVAWAQTSIGGNINQGTLQAPMRWERWTQVVKQLNAEADDEPMPVIVFPNLIEDHRIPDRDLGNNQSYFWAPLAVFNSLDKRYHVFALPTWSAGRFDDRSIDQIRQASGAWLVIRGGSDADPRYPNTLAASIIDEIRMKLDDQGVGVRVERLGPAHSDVQLYRARVMSPD